MFNSPEMMMHNDKVKEVCTAELEMNDCRYDRNPLIGEELKMKIVLE